MVLLAICIVLIACLAIAILIAFDSIKSKIEKRKGGDDEDFYGFEE